MELDENDSRLLVKAITTISQAYGLPIGDLSRMTGIGEEDLKDARRGSRDLILNANQARGAQQLLQLDKRLSAFFGDDHSAASRWLRTRNIDLEAKPIELIRTPCGLTAVSDYVASHCFRS